MNKFFLQNCLICKQSSNTSICEYCQTDLNVFDYQHYQHNLMHWPPVKKGLAQVDFQHVLAICDYIWPVSKLLTGLKFHSRISHAYALARLFNRICLKSAHSIPQLIIPIPLHKNRYLTRKYNQTIEISKHLSQVTNIPFSTRLIYRNKPTKQQTELTAVERKKNLLNAFTLTSKGKEVLTQLEHVVLFDDVITTGTTVNTVYKLIHQFKPELRVDIWSICITLNH